MSPIISDLPQRTTASQHHISAALHLPGITTLPNLHPAMSRAPPHLAPSPGTHLQCDRSAGTYALHRSWCTGRY
ncbi:hypothetical protein E2C01_048029 [Portunus trituberculatus]|uniref:Uncharacterized protein n=1 Tax=Portunus trituberculatus TaxID=210409 RepID=A0A5B7G588_PORTR|nr:hypothetical protein [Portunus trituberculatus]